ncbi:BadF/BadG/BcrA/BcrD ATPase family protein [Bradyrhizobium sp. STM 3562]|uniref:BadF/BadG/BcrA/BcrD ATPase family protein n=1 Tax=Bradyrhizobium sp. STM 3562 TaxID=578924 RepID=UPI003890D7F4
MMTSGALYLGIDGGGSRCRARIEDEDGAVLGEGVSGPATTRLGIDNAWRSIMRASEAAAGQAGLLREDFARMYAGIGLAGLGRRGAEAALKEIIHPFASVRFISDGIAACLGAHSGADGAIVVAGTGSIGVGLMGGRELRFGGYGFPISDEGSGADIGLQAIRLALLAADARGELSPLLAEVLGAFDHDPSQAVAWSEQATATDYATFAPMVLRHAGQGDPIGRRIVERAADAIGDLLDMFLRKGIERLSLVGGLSEPITPWLTPDLRDRLKCPDGDGVSGALLVARRGLGEAENASERTAVSGCPVPNL